MPLTKKERGRSPAKKRQIARAIFASAAREGKGPRSKAVHKAKLLMRSARRKRS